MLPAGIRGLRTGALGKEGAPTRKKPTRARTRSGEQGRCALGARAENAGLGPRQVLPPRPSLPPGALHRGPSFARPHTRVLAREELREENLCLPPSCSCAPGHASAPSGPRPALVRRRTERGQHAPRAGPASECPGLCGPQAVSIPASLSSQTSPDGSRAGREQASGAWPTGLLSANPRPPVQLTLTPPRMCF